MHSKANFKAAALARTLAIGLVAATLISAPAQQAVAQAIQNASSSIDLSVGRGRLVSLPAAMSDVFVANDQVADVQVRSARQLYIFGKAPGETSIYATDGNGRVVYSTVARVGNNIETIDQMLALAMPDAKIQSNTMNGFVLLTGTVQSPDDAAEAERLVQAFVGEQTKVLSRLRTATPLQVNLQVRIAEVNRTLVKEISGNVLSRDRDGAMGNGFLGSIVRGRSPGSILYPGEGEPPVAPGTTAYNFNVPTGTNSFGAAGRLFGMDLMASLDLGERSGMVVTLAQPNLTAISGETADFLAGGEFPIPIPPASILLIDDHPLLRQGRFMIAGLMNNRSIGAIDKVPGLGDVPILGMLFKSDSFRRGETELVIVVTPYLVKPVSANEIKLPTDGYQDASDLQRLLLNQQTDGVTGGDRPKPRLDTSVNDADRPRAGSPDAAPGFNLKK